MTYKDFTQLLLAYRKFERNCSSLYDVGVDLHEGKYGISDVVEKMLEAAIKSHYGDGGWEWVSWYIYEADWGEKDWSSTKTYGRDEHGNMKILHEVGEIRWGATDENGNPICYSHDSLYEYLENEHGSGSISKSAGATRTVTPDDEEAYKILEKAIFSNK
jgi:hypothetical protein